MTHVVSPVEIDAYTAHVMENIPADIYKTLNYAQIEAVKEAIGKNAPYRKHPIDLRATLSFYFFRFYFVFLLGRDRRSLSRNKESYRQQQAKTISLFAFLYTAFCVLLPIIFILLYLMESWFGIELFPNHLGDYLGW